VGIPDHYERPMTMTSTTLTEQKREFMMLFSMVPKSDRPALLETMKALADGVVHQG
jgi:hypothetical protein